MTSGKKYESDMKLICYSRSSTNVIGNKDFLDFLAAIYKINKVFENNGKNEDCEKLIINWNSVLHSKLVCSLFESIGTDHQPINVVAGESDSSSFLMETATGIVKSLICSTTEEHTKSHKHQSNRTVTSKSNIRFPEMILLEKLNELLEEGILDSILSYLSPKSASNDTSTKTIVKTDRTDLSNQRCNRKKERKKKMEQHTDSKSNVKISDEVEIHVYDEVKGFKKDFKCSQNLLISRMGYFAEVTKGQNLNEMDISVHCDITIFDWLMRWVKSDASITENKPNLDAKNVVPIMVSANFLQIGPLFQECLNFCKMNINEVIKFSPNLSCLNENILKRLADLLSNIEVQTLKDKKDKIRSKLFCKLITSLNEVVPAKQRGHYASLAYLYFCLYCGKLVSPPSACYVPCQLQYITISYKGDIISNHLRDPRWNLNDHIRQLWIQYKNWGRTYWRLWSQCHFLYCYLCRTMYAVEFSDCCPYHPQQPHFYPMEQFQTTNSPIGRYPCCGSKALRYETVLIPSGCKLRSHIPKLQTSDDTHIHSIIANFPDLIKQTDLYTQTSTLCPEKDNRSLPMHKELKYKEPNTGIITESPSTDQRYSDYSDSGLICNLWHQIYAKKVSNTRQFEPQWKSRSFQNTTTEEMNNIECLSIGDSESSDTSSVMDIPSQDIEKRQNKVLLKDNEVKPVWSSKYTIRHNQDNQRDYEELAFKAMSEALCRNVESNYLQNRSKNVKSAMEHRTNTCGGVYQQIEAEWKEAHKQKVQSAQLLKK